MPSPSAESTEKGADTTATETRVCHIAKFLRMPMSSPPHLNTLTTKVLPSAKKSFFKVCHGDI